MKNPYYHNASPSPTEEIECFPTHGSNPQDKLIELARLDKGIDSYCAGNQKEAKLGSAIQVHGQYLPVANNHYDAGFIPNDNIPSDCESVLTMSSSDWQKNICSTPLKAITKACPWNGGQVRNACGLWWVQSCPLSVHCQRGSPGG